MLYICPNGIALAQRGFGETAQTQPSKTTEPQASGWGTAIGSMIYGASYITASIITGIGTAKAFKQREKEFELELELQQKKWDAEREARQQEAEIALEQAYSGGAGIAGSGTLLTLGLLAGGLALVYLVA
jgi:uncharacterized protein HemX